MEKNNIVSLAQYKAELIDAANESCPKAVEPELPAVSHLWELLDKNISLSVWAKGQ